MLDIELQEEAKQDSDFQLVLLDKDYCPITKTLVPNGKKVTICSNDGADLDKFLQKHESDLKQKMPRKKRRKNKKQGK